MRKKRPGPRLLQIASIPRLEGAWMDQAACRDVDPDLFFPTGHLSRAKLAEPMRICAGCPVNAKCWNYAQKISRELRPTGNGAHLGHLGIWAGRVLR